MLEHYRGPTVPHPIRNVKVLGRRTSVRLEPEFWDGLQTLLTLENVSMEDFCNYVEMRRGESSFSSTMRAQILDYFRREALKHQPCKI